MAFCSQCGVAVTDGSRFCSGCGQVLSEMGSPQTTALSRSPILQDDCNLATILHLSSFLGAIVPFANTFAPLTIWLLKRHDSAFIDEHGKAAVNYNISVTIYIVIAAVLTLLLIGYPILIGLIVFDLIVVIIAAIRANDGRMYQYPLTFRFIS